MKGLRVLRLCSVFEPAALTAAAARYDAIGGMQNHTAELTRCLDRMAVPQRVLTSRLDGPAGSEKIGCYSEVVRTGMPVPAARQAWALPACWLAMSDRGPVGLVHAHFGEDLAVLPMARLAAWRHGCPLVVTVHTSVRHTLRVTSPRTAALRLTAGFAERRALPRADVVIVLSQPAADRLLAEGFPASQVRVIPPGYNPGLFTAPGPDPFPGVPRPRVAYIGRLARQKDPATLVDAFGRVLACGGTRPGTSLVVVGDGPDRQALRRRARPLGERVRFTGFLRHAAIPAALRHIDLLVLATWYEEVPSVLVEGMAAGVPVIASRVGGIPALVEDDGNGLLVPPGDATALAAAITRVLTEPGTAERLSAAGRRTARDYSWPALAHRVAAVYQEVTAGRRGTADSRRPGLARPG